VADHKQPSGASIKGAPEGPYENAVEQARGSLQNRDLNQFLDFVIALSDESARIFGSRLTQRDMRMVIDLMRSHFSGAPITKSSLAASSGLSYGTAMRAIETMLKSGLIVTRARTATGLSYSLHPSGDLISRWHAFAHRGEKLLREATAPTEPLRTRRGGRSKLDVPAGIIPPPTVLTDTLSLGSGLRILVHADTTFMAMSALKRQFELILGVPVTARALGIDQLHAELVGNSRRSQSRYDIIACDLPWFGEMAHYGRLLPLDRLILESELNCGDIYSDALESSRHEGQQFGIPVLTTGEILAYRTDLLAERDIAPPRTSDEVIDAGRKLHDPKQGVSGIIWNGGRGTALGHSFIMMMGAFGRPIVDLRRTEGGFDVAGSHGEALRPTFLSDEARQTVAYMRELMTFSPPNILDVTWYERASTYANGHAAMAYSHSLLAHLYETVPQSPAYRKTGYLPHPTGPKGRPIVPVGGYALSIPSNVAPARIPSVWKALKTLTSAESVKLYLLNGSLASSRASVSRDPEVQAISPYIATIDAYAAKGYLRMWPRPPIAGIPDIISIAGEEIHDLLSGRKSVEASLICAQNRADAIMRERGHY
jgi:multiple sugar transport system substrate-binding protein